MDAKVSESKAQSFWRWTPEETARFFHTDRERGLSESEAAARLASYGRNAFRAARRTSGLKIILRQLVSPLILVLIVAAAITVFIGHYRDAVFIAIAVIVNAALGFYQENKAERALAELKTYLKQRTRVIRDGHEREVDAEELVPGDVVRLSQGDRVPADARILFVNDAQVDEAVLTGESLPVHKVAEPAPEHAGLGDQISMVFAGTLVTQGTCTAIVCRTGGRTEIGKIAALIEASENEPTPLQAAILRFSIISSAVLTVLTVIVFVIGIAVGYSGLDMFLTAVAIAISAIPEGLPVSMTVILAVGVERMAKRKGVVRKLVAAEALGSTTVILTDKTGTLTKADMHLSQLIPFDMDERRLLVRALSNADVLVENPEDPPTSWRMNGRIMEKALVRSAAERGMAAAEILGKDRVRETAPFNAVRKFSASVVEEEGKRLLVLFGAPDVLLARSGLGGDAQDDLRARIDERAASGERVLGVASRELAPGEALSVSGELPTDGWHFDGLLAFRDPVRPGIKQVIARVAAAGIKTVILTGDHRGTAMAVAKEIGLPADERAVLDAAELAHLSDAELRARLPELSVISRVTPFDKMRVAKLFQQAGEVVAMTGDGVNDAPSIKQANVGIAMGSGTEVAQSVADLVLLDDNFETIVAAVEEGRQILGNIRKVLVYLLSNVMDGLILIGGSLLTGLPLPLNALQILWVNFFTDSFPAVAFAFERERDGLSQPPRARNAGLFDPLMRFLIIAIGVGTSALLFGLYYALTRLGYDPALVRTFIFATFGTYTLLMSLSVRSLERSVFSYPLFSNMYLLGSIGIGLVLMIAGVYLPLLQQLFGTVPLPPLWVVAVVLVGAGNILLIEVAKWAWRLKAAHGEQRKAKAAKKAA